MSTEREYEFFVTTEEPHHVEGQDRGRLRRVVMKNFFESQRYGEAKKSEHHSKETVQKKTNLKSRFRLPKPGSHGEEASAISQKFISKLLTLS